MPNSFSTTPMEASGHEYTTTGGRRSPHFWQCVRVDNVYVTRHGQQGSYGQATVRYNSTDTWAILYERNNVKEKMMSRIHTLSPYSNLTFTVPLSLLYLVRQDARRSSHLDGKVDSLAGHAIIAFYEEALVRCDEYVHTLNDPLYTAIASGEASARRFALAALAGYPANQVASLPLDDEALEVMAGLLSLNA